MLIVEYKSRPPVSTYSCYIPDVQIKAFIQMSQNQVRRHSDPKLWCPVLSTFHTKRVLQALGKLVLDYQHDHNHIII